MPVIVILSMVVLVATGTFHYYPSFLVGTCSSERNRTNSLNAGPDQIVHANDIVTLNGATAIF